MSLTRIEPGKLPEIWIPPQAAKCPICGGRLYVSGVDEWETDTGRATQITVECESEPDIDGPDWEDWFSGHYSMPYVDWLPLEEPLLAWFNRHYRIRNSGV